MGFQAKVSDEFKMYEQTSQTAFKEAAESEHGASSGCDLPLGTRGIVAFSGASAGQTKPKTVGNNTVPGKPFTIFELQVVEPEQAKGRKYNKYFDLSDHPNYSKAQKLCDMYDYLEDAGMPKEIRKAGGMQAVINWMSEDTRSFKFEVVDGYGGRRDIKPFIDVGGVPTGSATAAAMNAANSQPQNPQFVLGQIVMYAGKVFTLESVTGDKAVLKSNTTGNSIQDIPVAELRAVE